MSEADVTAAEAAHKEADLKLYRAEVELEAAYMASGAAKVRVTRASARYHEAADRSAKALRELVAARRRAAVPSFEAILRDYTTQMATGEVLASIEAYRNAKPASAGLPVERPK